MAGLLTTLNSSVGRVSMHGVHESVLEAQAQACRVVEAVPFGDLFLTDVRPTGSDSLPVPASPPLFPLWGRSTSSLAKEMIDAGLEAIITCVDTEQLAKTFVGRSFDHQLLEDLPGVRIRGGYPAGWPGRRQVE